MTGMPTENEVGQLGETCQNLQPDSPIMCPSVSLVDKSARKEELLAEKRETAKRFRWKKEIGRESEEESILFRVFGTPTAHSLQDRKYD